MSQTQRISIGWVARSKTSPNVFAGHGVRVMVYGTPSKALGAQKRYRRRTDEQVLAAYDILAAFIEVPIPNSNDGD